MTWKLTLEYDGTRYSGWQEQKNARTVQGELREAAEDLFGEEVDLGGAGRTDAGVHASGQVAHLRVRPKARKPAEVIRIGLNDRLPADIVVLKVEEANDHFHARHDALRRRYVYRISTRKTAFVKRQVWWVKEDLNVTLMARASRMLIGKHDFRCFRAFDPARPDESPVVVVSDAGIEVEGDQILFHIEASHFLWRMVRRIVGALVKLGSGGIRIEDFEALLKAHCSPSLDVAAWTAPASGLILEAVTYRLGTDRRTTGAVRERRGRT